MKGKEVLQWFIRLIRRGMRDYKEDEKEKQKLYEAIEKERT